MNIDFWKEELKRWKMLRIEALRILELEERYPGSRVEYDRSPELAQWRAKLARANCGITVCMRQIAQIKGVPVE